MSQLRAERSVLLYGIPSILCLFVAATLCGCGSYVRGASGGPQLAITANPNPVTAGSQATLTVQVSDATQVTVSGSDGSTYSLPATGGTQTVSPTTDTTYTAVAKGQGGTNSASVMLKVTAAGPTPTVTITADPTSVVKGNASTLTVTATNATQVTITDAAGDSYNVAPSGGTQAVTPSATTIYTATATGNGQKATAEATVTVIPPGTLDSINHVVFMLQENHTFDNYFGMLNPYRKAQGFNIGDDGKEYDVDGIDDKLTTISNQDDEGTSYSLFRFTSTCVDDMSSDWLSSYGDVERYNFTTTRPILMDGFVHTAEGFANSCATSGTCGGDFTDLTGERSMGYYDQEYLNYYYFMASQFAVSDRWFSPVATKSIGNRIATFTGGTTQGLVRDPGNNDHLGQLDIPTIFQELDNAGVSWKIYFTDYHTANGTYCTQESDCISNGGGGGYPVTTFSSLVYSLKYLYVISANHPTCTPPTQPSSVLGDTTNSFCIDTTHIAPLSQYFTDLTNNTLPSFAFIESGSGISDEHPGSGQSILVGQAAVASIVNALMNSPEWMSSVFFLSYDEGGGPYDHVPPIPGHSDDYTDPSLGTIPDIGSIAVNPDGYKPCVPADPTTPTVHCDLGTADPGANPADAAAQQGFAAQIGFRVPNIVISPFTRRHYVSHVPMDHTAIIKFVENRFINSSAHLTARDAAQPDLLDFFDFTTIPWATPPTPPPAVTDKTIGHSTCTPSSFAPQSTGHPVLNLFQY